MGKASCFLKMILFTKYVFSDGTIDDRHYSMWCEIKAAHHHHMIICQQFLSDLSLLHLSEQT